MEYRFRSIEKFINDLSAKKPTPGGGSVAALTAAFAAGLFSMVVRYSIGKSERIDKKAKSILKRILFLEKRFLHLADADIEAYDAVSYSNKESHTAYQKALKKATKVPLGVCLYCREALKMLENFCHCANQHLMSDLVIARKLFKTALSASLINVKINLRNLDDKDFIVKVKKKATNIRS